MPHSIQRRDVLIRPSAPADQAAVAQLYRAAFPAEDLLPVVADLQAAGDGVLSLVVVIDGAVVAHAAFTACAVAGTDRRVALLAPLAVAPDRQRQGIGRAVVGDGLARLKQAGVVCVLVLGDPAYYGRLGFRAETSIRPPYPLPDAWAGAWQSVGLDQDGCATAGRLIVPPMWQRPSLWGAA